MARPEITFGGDAEFLLAFGRAVLAAGGRRRGSPTGLVGSWGEFVRECEDGYLDDIEEFQFDLSVRRLIETLRRDQELLRFRELDWVWAEIAGIDERYRALLVPKGAKYPRPWWEAGIPRKAGPELAAEFLTRYGVRVEVVDPWTVGLRAHVRRRWWVLAGGPSASPGAMEVFSLVFACWVGGGFCSWAGDLSVDQFGASVGWARC